MKPGSPTLTCRMSSEPADANLHSDYGSIPAGKRSPREHVVAIRSDANSQSTSYDNVEHNDAYQRTPLLAEHEAFKGVFEQSDDETSEELPLYKHHNGVPGNIVVEIDLTGPLRKEPRFPKEKWKTFIAFIVLVVNFILTTVSLAVTHERVPDRKVYPPLPDVILDNFPALDWALDVSEILIMLSTNSCALLLFFHKHRFIVVRRVFLIMGLLYFMRSITMYVTVLPMASTTYYCSPKSNNTSPLLVASRVIQLISGFGLSINGKHTFCGDFIYSGHTVMLVLSYLIIAEYSPKVCFPVHWAAWCVAVTGVVMVLVAHGHYTIDVIIAYYVTTRVFWTYHTLANNLALKQHGSNNYLAREWWFPMFRFFEKNVGGPVPRQFDWPLPWPRRFLSKHPNRDS